MSTSSKSSGRKTLQTSSPIQDLLQQEESGVRRLEFKPFVVGVCGGTGSGKSLVIKHLQQTFRSKLVQVSQLDFHKNIPEKEKKTTDFDDPVNTDWQLMQQALQSLIMGEPFKVPQYNIIQQKRDNHKTIHPTDIIVIHGVLIFNNPKIVQMCDLKLFLDTDDDIRLSRRIYFDVGVRKQSIEEVVHRYLAYIKPSFEKYTLPYKKIADLIIPNYGGGYSQKYDDEDFAGFDQVDHAAVSLLVETLKKKVDHHKQQQLSRRGSEALTSDIDLRQKPIMNQSQDLSNQKNTPKKSCFAKNDNDTMNQNLPEKIPLTHHKTDPINKRYSVM